MTGHSRARGNLASIPHADNTMLMCDANCKGWTAEPGGSGNTLGAWVTGPNNSLGQVYVGTDGSHTTAGSGLFDLQRHRGKMNILLLMVM